MTLEKLKSWRREDRQTRGLDDQTIESFLKKDKKLSQAIHQACEALSIKDEFPDIWKLSEKEQIEKIQADFVNFYTPDTINPYIALSACGPWVITTCGAVLHDSGGYGMLGFGHDPRFVIDKMAGHQVMANVMTANFSQLRFTNALRKEIGHNRSDQPFAKFICANSGSEANSVAMRISDIHSKIHANGRTVKFLGFNLAFHGRTDRPAQVSDSTLPKYKKNLRSFSNLDNLVTIEPNDKAALINAFEQAKKDNVYFELMIVEPVMGEGNPGQALDPDFYELARKLTKENNTLLFVDAIQAGLRTYGSLSIVDYPGFEKLEEPDFESYSKALNAGQFPMSVLALSEKTANGYVKGVYGNTMTTNPRALDVATTVLGNLTEDVRKNIVEKGHEFVKKILDLKSEFPDIITGAKGTGLLLAADINPDKFAVVGFDELEEKMRRHGIGVIHGGKNALRFTPHFEITSDEIDLIIDVMRNVISKRLN